MKRRWTMAMSVVALLLLALSFIAYRYYDRLPWIDVAAYLRSQSGSLNCGHIVEPDYEGAQQAINCALSAHARGRPFVVLFSVYGIDEQVSNAVVGNSKGNALEIFYATEVIVHANRLMEHRCEVPARIQVEIESAYRIPRLHCAPWPPPELEPAHLFW